MDSTNPGLAFEKPILALEQQLAAMQAAGEPDAAGAEEIRRLRRELTETTREIYANLTPWQTVQVARHKDRPQTNDYLNLMFDEFVELHGDRHFGDDRAIELGIMLAVFRTMQQPGPDKPIVVIDGPEVIDTFDLDRFLLQQLPVGVVAVDRVRGGGEVMLS